MAQIDKLEPEARVLNNRLESIVKLAKLETIAETDKFGTEARFLIELVKKAQIDKLEPEARVLNHKLETKVKLDNNH